MLKVYASFICSGGICPGGICSFGKCPVGKCPGSIYVLGVSVRRGGRYMSRRVLS